VGDDQRRERDRPQDLDRDPADEPAVRLERPGEQRRRRARVLRAGVPRAARQLGGDERVPVTVVEGVYGSTDRPDQVRQSSESSWSDRSPSGGASGGRNDSWRSPGSSASLASGSGVSPDDG
jgi:hypothetical protein